MAISMKALVMNELEKLWLSKKITVFLLLLFAVTLLPLLTLFVPEVSIPFNGQNYALLMLQNLTATLLPLITIVMLVEMFSSDYEKGLLKNNLLQPVSRLQIMFSKYIVVLIINFMLLLVAYLLGTIVGMLAFGSGVGILTSKGLISGLPALSLALSAHIVSILPLAAFAAVVMLLTVLINSGTMALAASIAIHFAMAVTGQLLSGVRPWLITGQLELYMHILEPDLLGSLFMAVMIILVWAVVALLLASWLFKKKQIYT